MIRVEKASDVLSLAGLSSLQDEQLLAYLQRQRWFGLKGTAMKARVVDVVRLPWDESRLGIAFIEVETAGGVATYQLPLSVRRTDAAQIDPVMVVARIESNEGDGALLDAIYDPIFQKQLGATFLNPCDYDSEKGAKWSIERVGKSSIAFRPEAEITVGSAEQSNSALVFDRQAFLKLFRRIEPGTNPDVEVTRFLTQEAGFPYVPTLFGTITYVVPSHGVIPSASEGSAPDAICGMMQEYVAGSTDAWSYLLTTAKSDPASTARDVEKLGAITREMHDALAGDAANAAGPEFTPLATESGDVERWSQ
jgi:predicted trehalose synthase